MSPETAPRPARLPPLWGELRYGGELLRLLADGELHRRRPNARPLPVMLIPGFLAGDASLTVLNQWLRRRGHRVAMSGIIANVGCAERTVARLEEQLRRLTRECSSPAVLVGQSRGGALARALALRGGDAVSALVMLGSPVCDPYAVSAPVMRSVRWLARLGDLGLPGVVSSSCASGTCCARFRKDLVTPLPADLEAVAVHSRSDAIVDWRACLDPHARAVEVDSSHCGMSVHPEVFRVLARVLDDAGQSAPRR
jgi:pimeloyl-ACP methyl ester carboxylesterase